MTTKSETNLPNPAFTAGNPALQSAEQAMRSILGMPPLRSVTVANPAISRDGWRATTELRIYGGVLQQRWLHNATWSHAWRDVPNVSVEAV